MIIDDRILKLFHEIYLDLKEDCIAYDNGNERKAKDIAGRLRTLLKDGGRNSNSLLSQIGKKDIDFFDYSIPYTKNTGFSFFEINAPISNSIISVSGVYMGLVYKKVDLEENKLNFKFRPLHEWNYYNPIIKTIDFNSWWDNIIYEDPNNGFKLSRKDLILSISEQDGFAHVDSKLKSDYEKFLKSDALELVINSEKICFKNNPAKVSVREIGFEIIKTFEEKLKDIIFQE